MKRINKQNGITLIALVITIIVMLILVSVTISMAINGNLFSYAGKGAKETEQAKQEEQEMSSGKVQVDGVWYDSLEAAASGTLDKLKYKEYKNASFSNGYLTENAYWVDYDEEGNEIARAVVPKGFKVIEGFKKVNGEKIATNSIADGLVIQDAEGNEFVWIPVEVKGTDTETSIASFYRSEWSGSERGTSLMDSTIYKEPLTTGGYEGEEKEYYDMLKSVYLNKGFYVGRYEAGSTIERTSAGINADGGNGTTPMVVKQGAYPYIYVGWGTSNEDYTNDIIDGGRNQGIGALALCKNMYAYKDVGVTSTLIYGIMWDSMMDFIWENASENEKKYGISGFNSSPLVLTGSSDDYCTQNLYDISGNAAEWTMENGRKSRVIRDGEFTQFYGDYNSLGVGFRGEVQSEPYNSFVSFVFGFRPALYITVDQSVKDVDIDFVLTTK